LRAREVSPSIYNVHVSYIALASDSDSGLGLTLLNGDFTLVPSQKVGPLFTRVLFAHLASLFTVGLSVADDSHAWIVMLVADSDPGNTVG
jgi:hypothetical protein